MNASPRNKRRTGRGFQLVVLALFLGLMSGTVSAQYFGRNKVQYEKFNYQVLRTDHFLIYYYPEEEAAIRVAAQMAERWYVRLSRIFNHDLKTKQALIMYASHPQFEQTTVLSEMISEGTGGVTESFKRRIILPFGASLDDTNHVIGHELVHAFQYDMAMGGGQRYNPQGGGGGIERAPLFLIEGAAEYFSIGPEDPHTAMWMRDMIQKKKIPTLKDLENPYKYFAYRYGQAVWAYIAGRWGDIVASKLMKDIVRGFEYEKAFERDLGITTKQFSEDWHAALKAEYGVVEKSTDPAGSNAHLLIKGTEEDSLNCAPAVSPDGKRFVFISSRDLFSIEMFMGDAQTGKVIRKLTKTSIDPHFQSIQFIYSAGSWNSDGSRFAFGAVSAGKPVLAFMDADGKRLGEDIVFPELGEILNPTWSPDGKKIAFSALTGGYSDLYIYDFETKKLQNMTSDPYGDLQPAWSPDGKWIAFITERFTTQLSMVAPGDFRLALLNPATGEIRELPAFQTGKHISPQWSADGRQLFFISDRDGISNLYRLDRSEGRFYKITNLYTGVSGITALSPSLSIASRSNDILYGVYDMGIYSIYKLNPGMSKAGTPVETDAVDRSSAMLPPKARTGSELLGLLRNYMYGLPTDPSKFTSSPYEPKLTLDYVTPPSVGVGVDRYGSYANGGVALTFSDMLGQHSLMAIAEVNGRLIDSAAIGVYTNAKNRMNWGFVTERMPYSYGGYSIEDGTVAGEPAYFVKEYIYRQIYYQLGGFATYPFSPAQRVEVQGGYSYVQFANSLYTSAYSYYTGSLISYEDIDLPSAPGLHMPFLSAALVYDTSLFGATGPVIGQSYRLEVSPTFGTINYTTLTADYRKYVVPVKPFTLAFRFIYYGRLGKGAADDRLYPMYLGYGTLIRGYEYNSFTAEETDAATGTFDYNRLFGSSVAVANFELRFPLFGLFKLGKGYYGIFPVDFIAFYDSGLAWYNTDKATDKAWFLKGGTRKPLSSYGIGLRANLLGYMVIGVNYVKPIDRPGQPWHFAVSFWPGF